VKLSLVGPILFAAAASSMLFTCPTITLAAADLMVYPTRIVMTDRQRTAQVDIVNTSQVQATYKISMVRRRMTETGQFQDVSTTEPEEKFADEVVKYSPRQVTLVPGAGQTIRIMFKVTPNLAEGEYRSHLLFAKPPAAVSELPGKEELEPDAISMKISANIGISIPVIARHGNLEAKAAIDPASVKISEPGQKKQLVGFTLARTGTRSIYGDVVVYRGKEKVAEGNGFAVYIPNRQRKVGVSVLESFTLKPGDTIKVVFTERDEKKPMAETTVVIP
jgi:P pilus assembly chaperone PapD